VQDFMVALAEGKQTVAAIPVPPERKTRRLETRKERRTS
jgi:hypothetical protein